MLGLQGLFLIIIGLIAFFGGFVGVYDVSHGHTTPGALIAVLGVALAWVFLLGGIGSFLCAQGLLTWQRWAVWLTIGLELTTLIVGFCALTKREDGLFEGEGMPQATGDPLPFMQAFYGPLMQLVEPGDVFTITFRVQRQ